MVPPINLNSLHKWQLATKANQISTYCCEIMRFWVTLKNGGFVCKHYEKTQCEVVWKCTIETPSAVQFELLDKKQRNYSKKISKKEIPYLKSLLDEISNDFRKNKPIKKSN